MPVVNRSKIRVITLGVVEYDPVERENIYEYHNRTNKITRVDCVYVEISYEEIFYVYK